MSNCRSIHQLVQLWLMKRRLLVCLMNIFFGKSFPLCEVPTKVSCKTVTSSRQQLEGMREIATFYQLTLQTKVVSGILYDDVEVYGRILNTFIICQKNPKAALEQIYALLCAFNYLILQYLHSLLINTASSITYIVHQLTRLYPLHSPFAKDE